MYSNALAWNSMKRMFTVEDPMVHVYILQLPIIPLLCIPTLVSNFRKSIPITPTVSIS